MSKTLKEQQLEETRRRVRAGIESMKRGEYHEYQGRRGLKKLADEVKAKGRQLLDETAAGE